MLSDRGMAALRSGAVLVHAVPSVRLRLRHGAAVLLDVARSGADGAGGEARCVSACAFHAAVARAHAQRRAGVQLRFLSLPEGVDPALDVGVPPGDEVLAGGIVRAALGGTWIHAVAIARPLDDCLDVLGDAGDGLGFHHDGAVGVTLVHAQSPLGDRPGACRALELVQAAVARCAVAELEDLLRARPPGARVWRP